VVVNIIGRNTSKSRSGFTGLDHVVLWHVNISTCLTVLILPSHLLILRSGRFSGRLLWKGGRDGIVSLAARLVTGHPGSVLPYRGSTSFSAPQCPNQLCSTFRLKFNEFWRLFSRWKNGRLILKAVLLISPIQIHLRFIVGSFVRPPESHKRFLVGNVRIRWQIYLAARMACHLA